MGENWGNGCRDCLVSDERRFAATKILGKTKKRNIVNIQLAITGVYRIVVDDIKRRKVLVDDGVS